MSYSLLKPGTHIEVEKSIAAFKVNLDETIARASATPNADQYLIRAHTIFAAATVEAYRAYLTCIRDGIPPMETMEAAAALGANGLQLGSYNVRYFILALSKQIGLEDGVLNANFVGGKDCDPIITKGGWA